MENFFDGVIYEIVKKDFNGTVKDLARRFLVYGTLAEIFARKTGFNRGLGGSMHAFLLHLVYIQIMQLLAVREILPLVQRYIRRLIENRDLLLLILVMLLWLVAQFGRVSHLLQWTSLENCGRVICKEDCLLL